MSPKRLTVWSGFLIGVAPAFFVQSQAEAQSGAGGLPNSGLFSTDALGNWLEAEKSEVFVPVLNKQSVDSREAAKSGVGGPRLALAGADSRTTDIASGGLLGAANKSNAKFGGFLDGLGAYTYASPSHWSRAVGRLQGVGQGEIAEIGR